MSAGKLTEQVRIEQFGQVDDGYGGLEDGGWSTRVATVFAQITPKSAREREEADQLTAETQYDVVLPNIREIQASDRLIWLTNDNLILEVRQLNDEGARPIYRTLVCEGTAGETSS